MNQQRTKNDTTSIGIRENGCTPMLKFELFHSAVTLNIRSMSLKLNQAFIMPNITADRQQSKTILTIDERRSKIPRKCFLLTFVASLATNGNQKLSF